MIGIGGIATYSASLPVTFLFPPSKVHRFGLTCSFVSLFDWFFVVVCCDHEWNQSAFRCLSVSNPVFFLRSSSHGCYVHLLQRRVPRLLTAE